jgi:hypothetical protein
LYELNKAALPYLHTCVVVGQQQLLPVGKIIEKVKRLSPVQFFVERQCQEVVQFIVVCCRGSFVNFIQAYGWQKIAVHCLNSSHSKIKCKK